MRTVRLLTVSQHTLWWVGVHGPGGGMPAGRGGGVGGVPGPGGAESGGRGCGIPACTDADPPIWTEFLTHATENITLLQLRLQAVKIPVLAL